MSVAVFDVSSYATVAATGEPPAGVSVNVVGVRVPALIERLNVTVTFEFAAMPVALLAGETAVVSGAAGVPASITTASRK